MANALAPLFLDTNYKSEIGKISPLPLVFAHACAKYSSPTFRQQFELLIDFARWV